MSSTDEIVLGEGVAIDAAPGSVVMRAGSGLIDYLLYSVVFGFIINGASAAAFNVNEAVGYSVLVASTVLCYIVLPATIETLTRGLSVGKLAVGLRIVRDDGGPISARYAFGRALMGFFEIFLTTGIVAVVASFLSAKGKRVGDMMVGTYAMRTRGGRAQLPPVQMPIGLAEWALAADISRLPDGLALTARLFIGRAHQLAPEARYRIGTELAQQIAKHVSPMPTQGTHPENFIAAVLVARRDREFGSASRAEQRAQAENARLAALPYGIVDAEN